MLRGFTPEIYISYAQFPQSGATLVVRAAGGGSVGAAERSQGAGAPVDRATRSGRSGGCPTRWRATYGDRRALSWLLVVFAGLALGLTILGIASVVSFTVAQRVPEIGVRIALGANRGDVVRLLV